MTNEEAIQFLSQIMDALLASNSWLPSTDNPIKESFGMAINALTAQPETHEKRTETHACDCIERQAAIDALKEHRALFCDNTPETFSKLSYAEKSRVDELDMAIATLVNLPSAEPKREECEEREQGLCPFYAG